MDQETGSIVEIAKKDQTFLRHVAELGVEGAVKYAKISQGRANHVLRLPAIQQYLRKVLDSAGITDDLLAARIREGLDAVSQKDHVMKDADGNQALVAGPARVDYDQRGKYIDRALAIQGLSKPETAAAGAGAPLPSLGALAALSPEELKLILDALKRQQAEAEAIDAEVVANPPSPEPATSSEPTSPFNDDTPSGGFESPAGV